MDFQILSVTIASFLLSGNLFFIKKLVDKIEASSNQRNIDHASISLLSRETSNILTQLKEIREEIRDLRRIEIEVAILRDRANNNKEELYQGL